MISTLSPFVPTGVGSDPNYNPHGGYGGGDFDVSAVTGSVMSGLGSAFGALSTVAGSAVAAVQDESTRAQLTSSVVSTAGSFWGGLSAGASNFVATITQPDDAGNDGLADLQRQFHSQSSAKPSKYSGFGSDSMMGGRGAAGMGSMQASAPTYHTPSPAVAPSMPTSTLGEAIAGPGEDPNGIERLSGESDEQYVMRQTRLRDEAKARMAAKFGGGGGMGGVGSNSMGGVGSAPSSGGMSPMRPALSSNGYSAQSSMSAPSSGNLNMSPARPRQAPSSGNSTAKVKVTSGDDFFANFGT